MWGRARAAAAGALARNVEIFERLGYRRAEGRGQLEARLEREGGRALTIRMAQQGKIFGGSYALELATADPVFPPTAGLAGRGRGLVKLSGVGFRARRGDDAGARLARCLGEDAGLGEALARVHFERIRVEPDGRPVIRHMGGSLVWVLFPPLVRPVPLVDEQARATVAALEAFAASAAS